MIQISPFAGIVYNQQKVKDLDKVFCPPYDVISPSGQEYYYQSHPQNFIRLILGKQNPSDGPNDNRYLRAQQTFTQWLNEGVMIKDDRECLYFYLQEYTWRGEKKRRSGFIALMRLEEEADKKIFPHEKTYLLPKEDRLEVLKNVQANLSPIFVLFPDQEKNISLVFSGKLPAEKPFIEITDNDQVCHRLWRINDAKLIDKITSDMQDKPIFIADGHHRFEVALEYRRQMVARQGSSTGKEDFNYIMTYFTDLESKDLLILPTHRIVRHLPAQMDFLEEHFRVEKVKTREELLILLAKAGMNEHVFGLCQKDKMFLLRLKSEIFIDRLIKDGSLEFRRLDVTILNYFILDRLNIISEDLCFSNDPDEAMGTVEAGKAAAAFLLNPIKISQLWEIATGGERMPPKTTYFYPKVLSGLVVNKLEKF